MAQGLAHQSRRALHLLQGDRAVDGQAKLWPHRQYRFDRRQGRQPQRGSLLSVKGWSYRADEIAWKGTRRLRNRRQRGDPRRRQDRDLRPDDAAAYRLHARRFQKGASFWWKNSRRWWRGWPRRIARFPPAPCSIFPAAA